MRPPGPGDFYNPTPITRADPSRVAHPGDFEPVGSAYEEGAIYDGYRRYPFFADRAQMLVAQFPTADTFLIAGCGWGYLNDELLAIEPTLTVWGMDISSYAVDKANSLGFPGIRVGDAGNIADVLNITAEAGLFMWDVVVTEELLPFTMEDSKAQSVLDALRPVSSNMIHIVTPYSLPMLTVDGEFVSGPTAEILWKSAAEWKAFVSPDLVYAAGEIL